MSAAVRTGLDVLRESGFAALAGRAVGLMTNHSAVASDLTSAHWLFAHAQQVNLLALFSPEHGLAGHAADGVRVENTFYRDVPVYSLYGEYQRPTAAMLEGLDVLVCDIQDIGVRYYTYLWTLTHLLEAAGEAGVPVLILDRPNPLGGQVRGRLLDNTFASLVGRFPIPICHGMTLGELAQMICSTWIPKAPQLEIIRCEGWNRSMTWEQTGLQWVSPSPNMPHPLTAWHYPGACLIEGTNLSEGRGTALPFEVVGAPYVFSEQHALLLNNSGLRGVRFRPHTFQPNNSKWAGQVCTGIQVHLTDASLYDPLTVWLTVIAVIRRSHSDHFQWVQASPTARYHFDLLVGTDQVRLQLDQNVPVREIMADWEQDESDFARDRQAFLIYDE